MLFLQEGHRSEVEFYSELHYPICAALYQVSQALNLDGHTQDKGKPCEGEQSRMKINRDENREKGGAGKRNAQEANGRVCQAQHMKA